MKQKVFCDVELLKIVFFKNKMSLGYIGYFQDMISFISREKTVVIFEGYIDEATLFRTNFYATF